MKKIGWYILCAFHLLWMASCNDTLTLPDSELKNTSQLHEELIGVFPLAHANKNISRTLSSFETNWEEYNSYQLISGTTVYLPWTSLNNPSQSTSANFDSTLAFDVKKEDGWVLLFHTLLGSGNIESNKNYIFLYNQRTGFLKVFYYFENSLIPNNTGFWEIFFSGAQKWLNTQAAVSVPINTGQLSRFKTCNAAIDGNYCFHARWNVFQCQLSYDPSPASDVLFDLRTYNTNISNVNLVGNFTGYSKGTAISRVGTDSQQDLSGSLVSMVGAESYRWISDSLLYRIPQSRVFLKDALSKIVGKGLNLLFNSLTSSSKPPTPTVYDLQFQTQMKGGVDGTLSFSTEPNIPSVRITNFNKEKIGCELGTWNLRDIPTVYVCPIGTLVPSFGDFSSDEWYYKYKATGNVKYDIVINPNLEEHIIDSWVQTDLVRYYPDDSNPKNPISDSEYDYGTLGRPMADNPEYFRTYSSDFPSTSVGTIANLEEEDLLFGEFYKHGSIYRDSLRGVTMFRGLAQRIGRGPSGAPRRFIDMSRYIDNAAGGPIKYNAKDRLLRVTLFTVTDFEGHRDTTMSTKTFIPKLEWDPKIIEKYKNLDPSALENYIQYLGSIY